ncbi:MAG: leucine-rich repeat protein [Oscillospiraceae bacterium]|nr:leucine-rich repeat protein [Oscillospiraceae bacterium]
MKKALSLFLAFVLIAGILTPAASAQTFEDDLPRPVLPNGIPEANLPPVPDQQSDEEILLVEDELLLSDEEVFFGPEDGAPGELIISVQEREPQGSVTRTWVASAEGGTAPYYYQFYMVLPTYINGKWMYYSEGQQLYSAKNSFSFTFQYDGAYQLWVDVKDSGGHNTRYKLPLTVEGLGVQPLRIEISNPRGEFFTEETTWSIGFAGGDGYYKYNIVLVDLDMDFRVLQQDGSTYSSSSVLKRLYGPEDENEGETDYARIRKIDYSYKLLASSHYELRVWLYDSSGQRRYKKVRFSAINDQYPSVYEVASDIVSQCRAEGVTGDYETALWLHDWLTYNADYDQTYGHYHADGVLCGGYGVCDSYAKAYYLLLKEAGIKADRINNIDHAWNAVELGGEWYYVDCTWDDNGYGMEHHQYCFVPEEILSVDHPSTYDSDYVCNNYLYNYYVQDGEAQVWADSLAARISEALQDGIFSFFVPFPQSYTFEGKLTGSSRLKAGPVLADKLSMLLASQQQYVYLGTGETIPLRFAEIPGQYDGTGRFLFAGQLDCEADFPMISLPAGLETVEAEAFRGDTSLRYVIVPEGTKTIGDGAFADCGGLWMVLLPESVTSIAADAFDKDNPHLTFCVPPDSYAKQYVTDHLFQFQEISN